MHTRTHDTLTDALNNLSKNQKKLKTNGSPLSLYAETLLVVDRSVYDKVAQLTGFSDQDSIFQYMRIYLSHMVNGVNSAYENSFKDDPDLRISIRLANFYFLTVRNTSILTSDFINNLCLYVLFKGFG